MEHTATFERYQKRASRLLELRQKYGLPGDALSGYIAGMEHFQVVAPLIGEFSTGKSSLVNALLGRSVLSVNITPETAVPTEICYSSDEHAVVFGSNGGTETISVDEFQKREFSVDKVKKVQLYLNNAFLREISSVKLVDMPGSTPGLSSTAAQSMSTCLTQRRISCSSRQGRRPFPLTWQGSLRSSTSTGCRSSSSSRKAGR